MLENTLPTIGPTTARKPLKLGFAGVGWIGRNRLDELAATGLAEIAAVADPDPAAVAEVRKNHPAAKRSTRFESLLDHDLDGIVIATPSALHATQSIAALEQGLPVFCQKPLGRNARETKAVIAAACRADLLLGVDLSYRHTRGMREIQRLVLNGALGEITSVEAVFHNAYGPDKEWFYSRRLSGGGCLLDLGRQLVDLALWCLGFPQVESVRGWTHESPRGADGDRVEDHATGVIITKHGTCIQLACSWGCHAGCDADIRMTFLGTKGGACFRNLNGSFYDFQAERFHTDRSRETLASPPDAWGGRAISTWLRKLAHSPRFDPSVSHLTTVAATLDRIYQNPA